MKLKIVVIFTSLLIVIATLLFIPAIRNVSSCLDQSTARINASTDYIETLPSVEEKKMQICEDNLVDFAELNLCISKNSLSPIIIKVLPKARNTIQQSISSHNRICPNDPIPKTGI